jgi:hypothetical protein
MLEAIPGTEMFRKISVDRMRDLAAPPCPLLGVKRTSTGANPMSAFDPKRKSTNQTCRTAQRRISSLLC